MTTSRQLASALAAAVVAGLLTASAAGPKFYRDDPIWTDPETQDASGAQRIRPSQVFDFVENSFLDAGERTSKRAVNVNTVDEVPDSSWFTNRIGRERWPIDRIVRGPDTGTGPAPGAWTVIEAKSEGISPGLTVKDFDGRDLLPQVRSAFEPRDGQRRRGHLYEILPRVRLSHSGELHRVSPARIADDPARDEDHRFGQHRTRDEAA